VENRQGRWVWADWADGSARFFLPPPPTEAPVSFSSPPEFAFTFQATSANVPLRALRRSGRERARRVGSLPRCRGRQIAADARRERKARIVGAQPLICEGCGQPYLARRISHRYCSSACRLQAWRGRQRIAAVG
jgi:hypothetical protein